MRSLVEVCAEQRLENWRAADEARELRERLKAQGRRMAATRKSKKEPPPPMPRFNSNPRATLLREKALELYRQGMSSPDVGRELRLKVDTIKTWVKRAGIRGGATQRRDAVRVEQLRHTLRAEGRL